MRSKLIITGAIGVMAAATLTVNAQTSAHRTLPSRPSAGIALVAHTAKADNDLAIALRATESAEPTPSESAKPEVKESPKPDVDVKPAATPANASACATAVANLKAMHQADVAEDASERASAGTESPTSAAATTDRSEDATEAANWVSALKAAHTACAPAISTRCQAAVSGLQTVLQGLRSQEMVESLEPDWMTDFSAVRAAFSQIQMACPMRE